MWISQCFLGLIGLFGGVAVSGGVFALIIKAGVIPRLAAYTRTGCKVFLFEDSILLGGVCGAVITLFPVRIPVGNIGLAVYGIFAGIFLGCLIVALAEVLNVIPILIRRVQIKKGLGILIVGLALGKLFGALFHFWNRLGI